MSSCGLYVIFKEMFYTRGNSAPLTHTISPKLMITECCMRS